jgi:predicted TIM-barrel fold metal-dependent hydrolase
MELPFRLISADSHVVEPPGLWLERIDAPFRERAPRLVREDGIDYFVCEGASVAKMSIGFTSAALTPASEISVNARWENIYPGAWDPDARLADLERDGVEAEILYTSLGLRMYSLRDAEFQLACFRAFNDWLAEFCRAHPRRLFGAGLIPVQPATAGVAEMQRIARLGLRSAMISVLPDEGPGYEDAAYEPIWSAAEDLGLPISLHMAGSRAMINPSRNVLVNFSLGFTTAMYSIATLIFSGVFDRHPRLKVVAVENDAGWAPNLMERMDFRYQRDRFWAGPANGITSGRLPSEQFRQHVYCTFMRDHTAVRNREQIGLANLMWSSDFPHQDSSWPESRRIVAEHFAGVPPADQRRIARDNAIALYGLPLEPAA